MKYRLNQLPVKTTNGFQINDVEVELTIPTFHRTNDVVIEGDASLKILKKMRDEKISSKLGLEVSSYENLKITVPKGVKVEKPVFITYSLEKKDANISRLEIIYEEDSSCSFIIQTKTDSTTCFQYILENVVSQKNSSGTITFINQMNDQSWSFYSIENNGYMNSSLTHTMIDLGGKTRLYNVYSNLLEERSKNHLNKIYIGKEDSLLDFNYYINHLGVETESKMIVEGVLGDTSHKNFRGTIDFHKGCSRSIGKENENCILLSDTCRSRSLPQMLCGEEDVVGSHGVSSGKVEEDKLFYLMSRGYSLKEAEKMIVLGRFMHILSEIPSEDVRENVLSLIEEKLS